MSNLPPAIFNLPFRKSYSVKLSEAITQYISSKYDQHPDMFKADLVAVDQMRVDAVNVQEPHISGVLKLSKYAVQLYWLSGKFPIDMGADFSWLPSLGYNTNRPVTQNNLQFERANILYNLAALYSQLGTQSPQSNDQGRKTACGYFCAAAGVLKFLKEEVIPQLRSTPPEDMDANALECLEQLMLAQAQECFWLKAVVDSNKDSIIARLAASVSDFYDNAAEFAQRSTAIRSEWSHHMVAKQHHFAAAAQYRASLDCLERSQFGEEVARLKDALEAANDAIKLEGRYIGKTVLGDLISLKEKVAETLKGAEKDNDLIYLAPVPAASALPRLSRAAMAKPRLPTEIGPDAMKNLREGGPFGAPLFQKLVPFAVHVAANIYAERRDRLVNHEIIEELEALTIKLNDLLQSLNLPGALQALEKPLGLPSGIAAHAEEVRQQGGVEKLVESLQDIDKLKASDGAMYRETVAMLHAESAEDAKHRTKHGTDRWNRQTSPEAAEKLFGQINEYDNILQSADKSDQLVRNKLKDNEAMIRLLGGRLHDIEDFVPNSSRAQLTPRMDREVTQLRQCLNEVGRLQSRRQKKIEALREKAKADDINTALLTQTGILEREDPIRKIETVDFEPLFGQRLEQRYSTDKAVIHEELEEQEGLMSRIKDANTSFIACRRADSGAMKEREEALQSLENAYIKYRELIGNVEVGRKFYNDLARLLSRFRDECSHFVSQRRVEAGQIEGEIATQQQMRDMSLSLGAPNSGAMLPPPIPTHHPHTLHRGPAQNLQQQVVGAPPAPAPAPSPKPGLWRGDATTAIKFSATPPPPPQR